MRIQSFNNQPTNRTSFGMSKLIVQVDTDAPKSLRDEFAKALSNIIDTSKYDEEFKLGAKCALSHWYLPKGEGRFTARDLEPDATASDIFEKVGELRDKELKR